MFLTVYPCFIFCLELTYVCDVNLPFQAHLEDLAKKKATEKSDAAREAFLAELALDSKKGIAGRSDSLTHPHEKMKDKKKNKKNRKTKDLKVRAVLPGLFFLH